MTAIRNKLDDAQPGEEIAIQESVTFFEAVFDKIEGERLDNPILLLDLDHTLANAAYEITLMAAQIRTDTFQFTWAEVEKIFAFSEADTNCRNLLKDSKVIVDLLNTIRTEASKHPSSDVFSVKNLKYEVARWSKDAYYALRRNSDCSFLKTTLAARLRTKLKDEHIAALEANMLKYTEENKLGEDKDFDHYTLTRNKDVYTTPDKKMMGDIRSIIKVYEEQNLLINALKEVHATPYVSSASQQDSVKRAVKILKLPIAEENAYGTASVESADIIKGKGNSNDGKNKVQTVMNGMTQSGKSGKVYFAAGDTDSDYEMMEAALGNGGYALIIQNGNKLSEKLQKLTTREGTGGRVLVQRVNEAKGEWVYSSATMGFNPKLLSSK